MDYATGCWFVPDIHNRQGQSPERERLIRRRVTASDGSARARRRSSSGRGNRAMKLAGVVVGFAADGGAALGAHVVVFGTRGKDEQKLLAGRRRAATARAEEAGCLELLEAVAGRGHRPNSTPGL